MSFAVWVCPQVATAIAELDKTVLCVRSVSEYTEVIAMTGQRTLRVVGRHNLDIERLSYPYLSRLLAQIMSPLTAPLGVDGTLNVDVSEFQTNLEPYLRVHCIFGSNAPIISAKKAHYEQKLIRTRCVNNNFLRYQNVLTSITV